MTLTWAAIAVGVLLFLLAVGTPFWLSHRRLHPHEHTDAHTYLGARDQADESALPEQPPPSGWVTPTGTAPIGIPRRAGWRRPARRHKSGNRVA